MLLAKWKCIHESFPSEHAWSTDFIWSGKAYTSFNLFHTLNFFYKNYWSCPTWSSKCRGSISHGNSMFWFSGSANTLISGTMMALPDWWSEWWHYLTDGHNFDIQIPRKLVLLFLFSFQHHMYSWRKFGKSNFASVNQWHIRKY